MFQLGERITTRLQFHKSDFKPDLRSNFLKDLLETDVEMNESPA